MNLAPGFFAVALLAAPAAGADWFATRITEAEAGCARAKRGVAEARRIETDALALQQTADTEDLEGRGACADAAKAAREAGRAHEVLAERDCKTAERLRAWEAVSSPQGLEAMPLWTKGEVLVDTGAGFTAWDGKTPLRVGQSVRTGAGARAELAVRGGARVSLGPGTELTVGEEPKLARGVLYYKSELERATTATKIKALRTPTSAVGVRGTRFAARVQEGEEAFALFEGGIEVTGDASEQGVVLRPGQQLVLKNGQPLADPGPIDPKRFDEEDAP